MGIGISVTAFFTVRPSALLDGSKFRKNTLTISAKPRVQMAR